MDVQTVTDLQQPAADIANFINEKIIGGQKVLWLVSGGSSMAVAVAAAKLIKPTTDGQLTVSLTDERFGRVGHQDSNWQQLLDLGFNITGTEYIPVLQNELDQIQTTLAFGSALEKNFANHDVKIALFGIGADGHVAGILPHSPAVQAEGWATSYSAPPFQRITMTLSAIKRLDQAWLYFENPEKMPAVERLARRPELAEEPAVVLTELPKLVVYYRAK